MALLTRRWGIVYGRFVAVQYVIDGWLSLGVHVDFKHRRGPGGRSFGPYVDLHLGVVIVSIGWQPAYSSELERTLSVSRGGLVD